MIDVLVNKVMLDLFVFFLIFDVLVDVLIDEIIFKIKMIGLYCNKVKNIKVCV